MIDPRFFGWMLLTVPMIVLSMWTFETIVSYAKNRGWRSVGADLMVLALLSACFGFGLFLTFGR